MEEHSSSTKDQTRSRRERFSSWLKSVQFFVYCSHTLSAWGDRMWQFAVGLFLFKLEDDSLQLTAIYSFTTGVSVLLFGSLIGSWVDKYPRLPVARIALVTQNASVILSAIILCLMFSFKDYIYSTWDGWLATLSHVVVIIVADIAQMASMGTSIAIQRDWVVVISHGNKNRLANLNAVMRRIDLLTNILAPVLVGQIMTYVSMMGGAIFIASWNAVSVFVEYYLLWKVYQKVPQLAVKGTPDIHELEEENPKSQEMKDYSKKEDSEQSDIDVKQPHEDQSSVDKAPKTDDITTRNDDITAYNDDINDQNDGTNSTTDRISDDGNEGETHKEDMASSDTPSDNPSKDHKIESEDHPTVEDKLLDKTAADKPDVEKKSSLGHVLSNFLAITQGWKVYMRQETVFAGLGLSTVYMTVLGFDVITNAYGYSQGLTESILGVCMALGALSGVIGTIIFQCLRKKIGLERTGLFSSLIQCSFISLCVVSVWLPGSPFDLSYQDSSSVNTTNSCDNSTLVLSQESSVNVSQGPGYGVTDSGLGVECPTISLIESYASVVVFFVGIVCSRAGLWMFDLTITQIVQESVVEKERGVVGGVQNSFNMLLDMLKNIMVIIAPRPETFGILIIISFAFVVCGGIMYSLYSRKVRGHLFHVPPKCMDRNGNAIPNGGLSHSPSCASYVHSTIEV